MADLDTRKWIAAAHRYKRLRRRHWLLLLGAFGLMAVVGTIIIAFGQPMNATVRSAAAILSFGFLACVLASLATGFALFNFRCPRCENQFTVSWTSRWPTKRCKHCGLDLGPAMLAPMAVETAVDKKP